MNKIIGLEKPVPQLVVIRGKLFAYRLISSPKFRTPRGQALVDCGFNVWRQTPFPGRSKSNPEAIYAAVKTGRGYRLCPTDAGPKEIFTYKAFVERVIDGDTLWANIDCGFNTRVRQKLRLKAIDAPEIKTNSGRRARGFVVKALKPCPFIVIKTYQSDKYDRYLSDIFYLPGEKDEKKVALTGKFLNQELLNAGLAVMWKE